MKIKIVIGFALLLLSACDFNLNDGPGPQGSMSIKEAKKHKTFICKFTVTQDSINHVRIKTIFAEKQFWRKEGFFLRKEIDCCNSQLIIVSEDNSPFFMNQQGYGIDWEIPGFESPGNFLIYKKFKGIRFPDSIVLKVLRIRGIDSGKIIQNIILHKQQSKQ